MRTNLSLWYYLFCLTLFGCGHSAVFAQKSSLSFAGAFNMLNTGSKNSTTKVTYTSVGLTPLKNHQYTQKVQISYAIPLEIVFEYTAVKTHLSSDIASDPETYNNSSGNVKKAMENLTNAAFVKMSDYNSVNVTLNFRFNPAQLVVYGTDTGDFLNNTQSSPWDPGVYQTPNTAVSGTKIMVINK